MHKSLFAIILLAMPATGFAEQTRCGWFENPTPANAWLTDRDDSWILSIQGVGPVPGYNEVALDFSENEWIRTNVNYGFGCACFTGEFSESEALFVSGGRVLPLKQCFEDPALPVVPLPWHD